MIPQSQKPFLDSPTMQAMFRAPGAGNHVCQPNHLCARPRGARA